MRAQRHAEQSRRVAAEDAGEFLAGERKPAQVRDLRGARLSTGRRCRTARGRSRARAQARRTRRRAGARACRRCRTTRRGRPAARRPRATGGTRPCVRARRSAPATRRAPRGTARGVPRTVSNATSPPAWKNRTMSVLDGRGVDRAHARLVRLERLVLGMHLEAPEAERAHARDLGGRVLEGRDASRRTATMRSDAVAATQSLIAADLRRLRGDGQHDGLGRRPRCPSRRSARGSCRRSAG